VHREKVDFLPAYVFSIGAFGSAQRFPAAHNTWKTR